jgi:hypothetical protein
MVNIASVGTVVIKVVKLVSDLLQKYVDIMSNMNFVCIIYAVALRN